MVTKRSAWTLFDTLPKTNAPVLNHHPDRETTYKSSPRPGLMDQADRERDMMRQEEWRREQEIERLKDKKRNREKKTDPWDYYAERGPAHGARGREGGREWRDRDRRIEGERRTNGRPTSNLEAEAVREMERGKKKGDTFPRMTRAFREQIQRMDPFKEGDVARVGRSHVNRHKGTEMNDQERDRAARRERRREEDRYRERQSEGVRIRSREEVDKYRGGAMEDGTVQQRERTREYDLGFRERRRERDSEGNDLWSRREKDGGRERDRPKPRHGERPFGIPSPQRRRDIEYYSDREARDRPVKGEGKRDNRSEGDNDGDGRRQERRSGGEGREVRHRHSKSEGDDEGRAQRETEGERKRYNEGERPRYRDNDREREGARPRIPEEARKRDGERERRKERELEGDRARRRDEARDADGSRQKPRDRREDDRIQNRGEEEGRRRRETKGKESAGQTSHSASERGPRPPPQPKSSGEWSSDMESERRWRRAGQRREEREAGRESTAGREREVAEETSGGRESSQRECAARERAYTDTESRSRELDRGAGRSEQRRMWLTPERGYNSKDPSLQDRDLDRERLRWQRQVDATEPMEAEVGTVRGRDKQGDRNTKQRSTRETDTETERQGREEEDIDQAARGGNRRESEKGVSVDGKEESEAWGGVDLREPRNSSDGERRDSSRSDSERASLTDKTDESDRQEEGGRDHCTHSDSEGGSETGLEEQRDRMPSAEDGFVTVSSGGDEEREEEEFEDCKEYLDDGVSYHATLPIVSKGQEGEHESPGEWTGGEEAGKGEVGDEEGRKRHPTYGFCVIGQTLPRSRPNNLSDLDQMESEESSPPASGSGQCGSDDIPPHPERNVVPGRHDECNASDSGAQGGEAERARESDEHRVPRDVEDGDEPDVTDVSPRPVPEPEERGTDEGLKVEAVHPYAEIGPPRDSETDKLLAEWRARHREHKQKERLELHSVNPHGAADSQGITGPHQAASNETNTEAMNQEEPIGAIQVRVNEAWSKADEAKRHSQAPHLKWAKDVVSEIFGVSESQANAELHQGSQGRGPEKGQGDSTEGGEENSVHAVLQRTRIQDGEPAAELGPRPLQPEDVRGMGLSQSHVHADVLAAMRHDTPTDTHADTSTDTEREEQVTYPLTNKPCDTSVDIMAGEKETKKDEEAENESEGKSSREKEVEMYLTVCPSLYKPDSCPSLNYLVDPDVPIHHTEEETEGDQEERVSGSVAKEKRSVSEGEEMVRGGGVGKEKRSVSDGEDERNVADEKKREVAKEIEIRDELNTGGGLVVSKVSFRDLGPVARMRRRGIRKTTERRKEEHLEEEEVAAEEGVAGDRRTRIFSTPDDEETRSDSWGDVELRNVLDTIQRKRKNSRFFNKAQLYQQYNEAAQNIEILRQSRSDFLSTGDDLPVSLIVPSPVSSPSPSPPPARRPLPPLPPLPSAPQHHFLFPPGTFSSSVSAKTLPLPEPPKTERRASSPRLSASLGKSSTLWQELPGVRNSTELGELAEDQRRLQEVRFEVLTSEASYCRSLDIVVEHFVKSKQLGALLTAQDRNWLFSRLADVRAISHSFLSKLEERIDSDTIHFTVCDIIARYCPHFKMVYVPYLTNQSYQDATYQRLMSENPGFKRVVEKLERSTVCQRLPLRSFLILPFQRITRLKLLVQNILKRTAPGTEDETQAIKALKLLEKLIIESNDSITQMKSIESLVSLSAKVDFECRTLPLVSQSRRVVREGPVTEMMDFSMKESERNVYLHLFNDYLLLSLHKEGGRFIVIDHAPVSELRAENCRVKLLSLQKNLFRLYLSNKALLLRTDSQSDKLRWITAVSRPHAEIDYSAAQDLTQMQCIRAIIAQQPDEISLEKAEVILVHQKSSDGWVEGTRLSDRQRGWAPVSHLEAITSSRVRQRNLTDALKITTAAAAV